MKARTIAITAVALLALTLQPAFAAESVGYNTLTVPKSSDVRLALSFSRDVAEGPFTVTNVDAGSGIVTVAETISGSYADSYYVRFTSGNGEGLWISIYSSGTYTFDFDITDPNLPVLGYVDPNDTLNVYEHHTIGSVFPPQMYGKTYTNGTQVLIHENDITGMEQNKSAVKTAMYVGGTGGTWLGAGVGAILEPETLFILRNNSTTQSLQVIALGDVPLYKISRLIAANGDLDITSGYPVPLLLKQAGLEGNLRQVLFYDSDEEGQNKSAYSTAMCIGGNWIGTGANNSIEPSESITLRLPPSETGTKITFNKPY